ncbi:hypothetical protein EIP86_003958 [Pleurotus ostreatoroseus]|nr:hypothetical protein EIP86_003958 [Pleurotus ostreatoroseus]
MASSLKVLSTQPLTVSPPVSKFNALRDLAYNPAIEAYSPMWEGPPVSQLFSWGQLDALDVLNSAFAMTNNSAASPNVTSSPTEPNTASSSAGSLTATSTGSNDHDASTNPSVPSHSTGTHKISIIVGAVVGSLAAILLATGVTLLVRRRRNAKVEERMHDFSADPYKEHSSPPATRSLQPEIDAASNNAYTQDASQTEARGPALPQMISELASLLASLPVVRPVNEPPPQYEESNSTDNVPGRERATE